MKINQRQAEKQILDALMKEASKRIVRNRQRVQRDLEREEKVRALKMRARMIV